MRITNIVFTLSLAAGVVACSSDAEDTTGTAATPSLAVSLTPGGEAEVTLQDQEAKPVSTKGATGEIEFANGDTVPLTQDRGGRMLRAPLGDHFSNSSHGCVATIHVMLPGGVEKREELNLCREHAKHAGRPGHGPRNPP